MRYRRHRSSHDDEELDITAFMNLMVILVPFLLITAVFSQVAILELKLPPKSATEQVNDSVTNKEKPWRLEVIIHLHSFEVNYGEALFTVKRSEVDDGITELSALLTKIKVNNPDKTEINILPEHTVDYDTLIQVMDTVRVTEQVVAASVIQKELFPDISIGDAPVKTSSAGGKSK